MGIPEKIKAIQDEMARTQINKATEHHIGLLKAKIAKLKREQEAEVTKIYLEISRDCLSKGASADQVIPLRESSGRPTLTTEEYKAVLELNKFLRY